jgi:YgiT-type zinc finger domain-containing protein
MSELNPVPQDIVCPHCRAGNLRLQRVVFARWYAGQFITVPNFPAWVCDVCGEREYDEMALDQVRRVLAPEAELRREAARPGRRSPQRPRSGPRPSLRRGQV